MDEKHKIFGRYSATNNFVFICDKLNFRLVNPPFVQEIKDRCICFKIDLDAICSQCNKPFKEHKKWK